MTGRLISKIIRDQSTGIIIVPWLANTELVFFDDTGSDRPSNKTTSNTRIANITLQQTKATSSVSKVTITGNSVIWEALGTTELSNEIKVIDYTCFCCQKLF